MPIFTVDTKFLSVNWKPKFYQ